MRKLLRTFAAATTVAMLATACADAPEDTDEPTEETTDDGASEEDEGTEEETEEPTEEAAADFLACQVTDTGGVDDRSFNQTAYAGLERAEDELGAEIAVLESQSDSDYAPFINQFVSDGCDIIVTVGFLLDGATQTAAQENPEQPFAIIDVDFAEFDDEGNFVGDVTYDNVRELTFQTDQAAFLAGYLAASQTESGKIGTFGGINIPPVTIFMDGMLAGIRYYNQQNDASVELLGWDGTDGSFINNFDSQDDARNTTDQLIANGADIVMPVAGPAGLGTVAAAQDANAGGSNVQVIWVDTDGRTSVPDAADIFLTSVQKNMDLAVFESIQQELEGGIQAGLYVGTLENGGVGIPEDTLTDELQTIKDGIIAGEISVDPADYS